MWAWASDFSGVTDAIMVSRGIKLDTTKAINEIEMESMYFVYAEHIGDEGAWWWWKKTPKMSKKVKRGIAEKRK